MNIAIALNEKYARYGYVLLVSIFENNKSEEITVYVLNRDLSDKSLKEYAELAEKYNQIIMPIRIEKDMMPSDLPSTDSWTVEIYFRILLPYITKTDVERVLYLDTDTIVTGFLGELYNTPFDGNYFCASIDNSSGKLSDTQMKIFGNIIEKDSDFSYCNSGVLLINTKKLREDYTQEDFWNTAEELKEYLCAPDQDLINYMFYNKIKYIAADKYNMFARLYFNSGIRYENIEEIGTRIIHYSGPKPWSGESLRTDIEKFWWKYAKMTPYYYELLEELVTGEMNKNYINTNEFRYQEYIRQNLENEIAKLKNREKEFLSVIEDSKKLIETLAAKDD